MDGTDTRRKPFTIIRMYSGCAPSFEPANFVGANITQKYISGLCAIPERLRSPDIQSKLISARRDVTFSEQEMNDDIVRTSEAIEDPDSVAIIDDFGFHLQENHSQERVLFAGDRACYREGTEKCYSWPYSRRNYRPTRKCKLMGKSLGYTMV